MGYGNTYEKRFEAKVDQLPTSETQLAFVLDIEKVKEVFDTCVSIVDPDETDMTRKGGFLLIAQRKDDGFQVLREATLLGHLTSQQLKQNRDQKYKSIVFQKAMQAIKNPYSCDVKHMRYEKFGYGFNYVPIYPQKNSSGEYTDQPIPYGCIESQNSNIVIAFSGFLEFKDETFVLILGIISGCITVEHAINTARIHNNDMFLHNWRRLLTVYNKRHYLYEELVK